MKLLLLFHTNNNENKHTEYKQRQKPSQGKKMTNQAPSTGIRLLLLFFFNHFFKHESAFRSHETSESAHRNCIFVETALQSDLRLA